MLGENVHPHLKLALWGGKEQVMTMLKVETPVQDQIPCELYRNNTDTLFVDSTQHRLGHSKNKTRVHSTSVNTNPSYGRFTWPQGVQKP